MDIIFGDFESAENFMGNDFIIAGKEIKVVKNPKREELSRNIDVAYGFEESSKRDFIHHRNSGLNQVLAKIFAEKDIIIGFSFSSVLKNPLIIGRMRQNVRLCRKYGVKMVFGSFASDSFEVRSFVDLESFARTIGMNGKEIKNSSKILKDRLEFNEKKKKGKIVSKGVEILS